MATDTPVESCYWCKKMVDGDNSINFWGDELDVEVCNTCWDNSKIRVQIKRADRKAFSDKLVAMMGGLHGTITRINTLQESDDSLQVRADSMQVRLDELKVKADELKAINDEMKASIVEIRKKYNF